MTEKAKKERTANNQKKIWKFSSHVYQTLRYRLKHKPDENEILASTVWEQIEIEGMSSLHQTKNCIRAKAFKLVNMEGTQIY